MLNRKALRCLACAAVIAIICVLLCGSLALKRAEEKPYILGRGETLWEVYEEYGSGIKWDKWYYEMLKANGKGRGAEWYYGEEITIICTK